MTERQSLLAFTRTIVAAYIANNPVPARDVPLLINSVFEALRSLGSDVSERGQSAAISVKASIKPDYLVCLEDGRPLKMLKRYLRSRYGLSPDEYRAKWNLPADYPMTAPNYAKRRSDIAKDSGLGKSPALASRRGRRKR